jgi:hypothetical protein
MSPVRPADAVFEEVRTGSVAEALRILADEALLVTPVIDVARAEAEHEPLILQP